MKDIFDLIDDDEVSDYALSAEFDEEESDEDILNKQIECAYDNIALQLYREGVIPKENIEKYGNSAILYAD